MLVVTHSAPESSIRTAEYLQGGAEETGLGSAGAAQGHTQACRPHWGPLAWRGRHPADQGEAPPHSVP